jgi:hypothetical protein
MLDVVEMIGQGGRGRFLLHRFQRSEVAATAVPRYK